MADRRERPWRKLRVVVEVTVPPNSRAREKDLAYLVSEALPRTMYLPRPKQLDAYEATVRIKRFTNFWPMFLRLEKGLKQKKKENTDDKRSTFPGCHGL